MDQQFPVTHYCRIFGQPSLTAPSQRIVMLEARILPRHLTKENFKDYEDSWTRNSASSMNAVSSATASDYVWVEESLVQIETHQVIAIESIRVDRYTKCTPHDVPNIDDPFGWPIHDEMIKHGWTFSRSEIVRRFLYFSLEEHVIDGSERTALRRNWVTKPVVCLWAPDEDDNRLTPLRQSIAEHILDRWGSGDSEAREEEDRL